MLEELESSKSPKKKVLVELLEELDSVRIAIDQHKQATEARLKSAEEHKKAKAAALEAIAQLEAKKAEFLDKEQEISRKNAEIAILNEKLTNELIVCAKKQRELDEEKAKLAQERAIHQQNTNATNANLAAKHQIAIQHHQDLEYKLMQAAQQHQALKEREASVLAREQFLIAAANELTKTG